MALSCKQSLAEINMLITQKSFRPSQEVEFCLGN